MSQLTPRQRAVYDFIHDYTLKGRCPPTLAEVAKGMGFGITAARHYYAVLQKKGWIEVHPRLSRGVLCLGDPDHRLSAKPCQPGTR